MGANLTAPTATGGDTRQDQTSTGASEYTAHLHSPDVCGQSISHAELHDRTIAYYEWAGTGSTYLLVHGIGGRASDWQKVIPELVNRGHYVVAVDLPGHGASGKDRGDYSLGAIASVLRDLLAHLELDQVVAVGHSLGGGVAMQFHYQFPDACEGLVLVCSGGLGVETPTWLRAATLPGAEYVLAGIGSERTGNSLRWMTRQMSRVGMEPQTLTPESLDRLRRFGDRSTRNAFLATLRSVVDVTGQRVTALGKLDAIGDTPVLLIWGAHDPVIPVSHAYRAAQIIPNSELVVFPRIGHEPHIEDPTRVAELLSSFQERVDRAREKKSVRHEPASLAQNL
jgi:pimeloyl-ACP methyl ester carboxylesterase